MKYKMKRNEWKQFLSEQANLYYKGKLSWKEYMDLEVEYIPLDLTAYKLSPEIIKSLNILFTEEDTSRNGNLLLRGFSQRDGITEINLLNLHYGEYSRSLNYWAFNDEAKLLFTYCEGDTTCELFSTKELYLKAKTETEKWYKEEAA